MDKSFVFNIEYELEKITKQEALQGCKCGISGVDKRRWGDLVNLENARLEMLKDHKLSKQAWLAHANNHSIYFDG